MASRALVMMGSEGEGVVSFSTKAESKALM